MQESLVLWCLSKELFCKFLRPLTVLIPNCIYRCDIIHPLVRYHGRSRRSPAPPSGPLGGPSGPLGRPAGPLGGPSGRPNTRAACDTLPQFGQGLEPSNIYGLTSLSEERTFLSWRGGRGGANVLRLIRLYYHNHHAKSKRSLNRSALWKKKIKMYLAGRIPQSPRQSPCQSRGIEPFLTWR